MAAREREGGVVLFSALPFLFFPSLIHSQRQDTCSKSGGRVIILSLTIRRDIPTYSNFDGKLS